MAYGQMSYLIERYPDIVDIFFFLKENARKIKNKKKIKYMEGDLSLAQLYNDIDSMGNAAIRSRLDELETVGITYNWLHKDQYFLYLIDGRSRLFERILALRII